jgi:hypothetical protein
MASFTIKYTASLLGSLLFAQQVVSQTLTKPLIQPPLPGLDQGLWDNLVATQSSHDQWDWGCKHLLLKYVLLSLLTHLFI